MPSSSGYVRHFVACNQHDLSGYVPFLIGGKRYGRMKKDNAAFLLEETDLFAALGDGLALADRFADFSTRSEALKQATLALSARQKRSALRREMYAIVEKWGDEPLAQIDRAAVPWFGVRAWGVHVNGFVRKEDGIHLWIGERAANLVAYPGKLDNMIGGGQPIGLTPEENLCKEAKEEAGIDAALALTARKVRTMNYLFERPDGLRTDTLFLYDLELPESVTPRNTDGEVAAFTLMPLPQVADLIRNTDKFKFNCPMVIVDFMMRHGAITQQDAEHEELRKWLPQA